MAEVSRRVNVGIVFSMTDRATPALQRAEVATQRLGTAMNRTNHVGILMATMLAQVAGRALLLAGSSGLQGAAKSFGAFEGNLIALARVSGLANSELSALTDTFIKVSATLPLSANELTAAAVSLSKLGITANLVDEATGRLNSKGRAALAGIAQSAAQFSFISGQSIDTTTESLSILQGMFKSFGDDNDDIAQDFDNISSALIAVADSSASTVTDLTEFIKRAGGMAKTLGFSLPEILGFAGSLRLSGLRAQTAGSQFNRLFKALGDTKNFATLARIFNKTQSSLASLKGEGKTVSEELFGMKNMTAQFIGELINTGRGQEVFKGLLDTIGPITEEFKASGKSASDLSVRTSDLFDVLRELSIDGVRLVPVLSSMSRNLEGVAGATTRASDAMDTGELSTEKYNKQAQSLDLTLKTLAGSVENVQIMFGKFLSKALVPIVKFLNFLVRVFMAIPDPIRNTILLITTLTAVIAGAAITILGFAQMLAVMFTDTKRIADLAIPIRDLAFSIGRINEHLRTTSPLLGHVADQGTVMTSGLGTLGYLGRTIKKTFGTLFKMAKQKIRFGIAGLGGLMKIVPIALVVILAIAGLVKVFQALKQAFKISDVDGGLADTLKTLRNAFSEVRGAIESVFAGTDEAGKKFSFMASLADGLRPILRGLVVFFKEIKKQIEGQAGPAFFFFNTLKVLFSVLKQIWDSLSSAFATMFSAWAAAMNMGEEGAKGTASGLMGLMKVLNVVVGVISVLGYIISAILIVLKPVLQVVGAILGYILNLTMKLITALTVAINWIANLFGGGSKKEVESFGNTFDDTFSGIDKKIRDTKENANQNLTGSSFLHIAEDMGALKGPINKFGELILTLLFPFFAVKDAIVEVILAMRGLTNKQLGVSVDIEKNGSLDVGKSVGALVEDSAEGETFLVKNSVPPQIQNLDEEFKISLERQELQSGSMNHSTKDGLRIHLGELPQSTVIATGGKEPVGATIGRTGSSSRELGPIKTPETKEIKLVVNLDGRVIAEAVREINMEDLVRRGGNIPVTSTIVI